MVGAGPENPRVGSSILPLATTSDPSSRYRSILKSIVCLLTNRLMIISSIQSMEYLMHNLFHEIAIGNIQSHLNLLTHLKSITRNKKMYVCH